MQNNLPESIKRRIEDEAETKAEAVKKSIDGNGVEFEYYHDGIKQGYEFGASAVLSKPGDYGLAGVWVKASDMAAKTHDFVTVYARYKDEIVSSGYFVRNGELFICHCENYPIESSQFNDLYIWDESYTPSDRVVQLEQALREIAEIISPFQDYKSIYRAWGIATNALKQLQQ